MTISVIPNLTPIFSSKELSYEIYTHTITNRRRPVIKFYRHVHRYVGTYALRHPSTGLDANEILMNCPLHSLWRVRFIYLHFRDPKSFTTLHRAQFSNYAIAKNASKNRVRLHSPLVNVYAIHILRC